MSPEEMYTCLSNECRNQPLPITVYDFMPDPQKRYTQMSSNSPVTIRPDRAPLMRHNQELSHEQLRQEAEDAVEKSGKSQAQIARELEVSRAAVSRAVKETNTALLALQKRIVEHLTSYEIEEVPEPKLFRAVRKEG